MRIKFSVFKLTGKDFCFWLTLLRLAALAMEAASFCRAAGQKIQRTARAAGNAQKIKPPTAKNQPSK